MFTQLKNLLRKGDTVSVSLALENDTQLRVNVYPRLFNLDGQNSDTRAALNQPLSIVGTPAELDAEFGDTLARFTGSVNVLRHTLEEAESVHKTAAAKVTKSPAKSADKPATTPKSAPKPDPEPDPEPATPSLI
jgi:PRTRC genetic system protein E